VVDDDGVTALFRASQEGHARVVDEILHSGGKVDLQNSRGGTALHGACARGKQVVVKRLLAAKGSVNLR